MKRLKTLHLFLVMFVSSVAIGGQELLRKFSVTLVAPKADIALLVVGAAGLYGILVEFLFEILGASDFFLKLFWKDFYVQGLWVYTSNDDKGNRYRGIYRFDQNLFETRVVGFGLDDQFRRRTRLFSVTGITGKNGVFKLLSERLDWEYTKTSAFSATVIIPDAPIRRGLFRYPVFMRGETQIFGGPRDGLLTTNLVFERREDVRTEEMLIQKLKSEMTSQSDESGKPVMSDPLATSH